VISTVVTGFIGLLFRDELETFFFKPLYVPLFLAITGVILLSTRFIKERRREIAQLHLDYPLTIGAVQAFSMLPGVSRSGTMISASIFLGAARSFSSTYSFLLAIPSIFGASLVSFLMGSSGAGNTVDVNAALIGYFISLLSGYAALKILLRLVNSGKLYVFSFYCFAFAISAFILLRY
jgi:undecaprenyl-diphosphatase